VSGLRVRAEQYLAMRRALGFKLTTQGRLLLGFVGYLEQQGVTRITTEAALAWATATPHSADQVWWSRRLMVVRSFARHLQALDLATEVPPDDVLPHHYRRQVPTCIRPRSSPGCCGQPTGLRPHSGL
jgi:integrase/recombinase XerD